MQGVMAMAEASVWSVWKFTKPYKFGAWVPIHVHNQHEFKAQVCRVTVSSPEVRCGHPSRLPLPRHGHDSKLPWPRVTPSDSGVTLPSYR